MVYSTRLHVYTRASLTDNLARKSARVRQVGGQVGEDRRACPARGKLNGEADFRARIDRTEVGEDVRVGVGVVVGVGPMEFKLYNVVNIDDTY